nr:MAG TPA: putative terminase small subunit [Caudoviricetes sp.]
MGRRCFEPTEDERNKVYQLTAAGFTVEEVAKTIYRYGKPVSDAIIRRYFKKELEVARIEAVGAVAARLFKKAMEGDTASMIFYLKTRGGWKETQVIDNKSSDGSMRPGVTITKEQFAELAREIADEV